MLLEKQKKQTNKQAKNKNKAKKKEKNQNCTKSGLSVPISTTNCYIYHFLDDIKLLLFVNANVIHHV